MKYKILARFWGSGDYYSPWIANNIQERDHILNELKNHYSITSLKYCKIYKDGTEGTNYKIIRGE